MSSILRTGCARSLPRAPHASLFANRILSNEWVILGVTDTGAIFDVPDWPERLCGLLSTRLQDKRVRYSDYLQPAHIDGFTAVVMSRRLEQDNPASFTIVQQFVTENQLHTRYGRTDESTIEHPVLQQKLREYIKG